MRGLELMKDMGMTPEEYYRNAKGPRIRKVPGVYNTHRKQKYQKLGLVDTIIEEENTSGED